MNVTLIDYGTGNIFSVRRAFEACGAAVRLASHPSEVKGADRLVVPGVGAFGNCVTELHRMGFREPIVEHIQTGRPFLGICVGMQMLLDKSFEFGEHAGLGVLPGTVEEIPRDAPNGRVRKRPHIGWAPLSESGSQPWSDSMMKHIEPGTRFYFVHTFSSRVAEPEHVLATCDYDGFKVVAAIRKENVQGTQFHPEKSGCAGLEVLKGFLQS